MTGERRQAQLVAGWEAAAAVQRRVLEAGESVDAEWRRLGWQAVDAALDALLETLPDDRLEQRRRLFASVPRSAARSAPRVTARRL